MHGKLIAQPGKADELANILLDASQALRNATGCHLYLVLVDEATPDAVFVTEVWDTKEDHDNSLKDENVRNLIMKAVPIINMPIEKGQELKLLGGLGI